VEVFQSMYASCDFAVLQLFEGVRRVGKATVHGSVGDGEYARWLEGVMMTRPGERISIGDEERLGTTMAWDTVARQGSWLTRDA